ncbi:MAG: FAD-binding oxidoreductase [Planctomycetes bacterium]|nr:FAD-binding oxidoreductase [Planctomycetota bacterium]
MSTATVRAPHSIEAAVACVREAARDGAVILPTGCGSKRSWANAAPRVDVELSTRALTGVVAYEPGEGVITALAGTCWAELQELVARHGHHLSPWIPDPASATVGGVVAAGQSGADRLRYGPLRHHVLGMRVVTGAGQVVQCGGRLVKNVTGFDLHRLHTGAHGTLGLVAEVSLRLHAAPEVRAAGLAFVPTRQAGWQLAGEILRASRLAWTVMVHDLVRPGQSGPWLVAALVAGPAPAVRAELAALRRDAPQLPWLCGAPQTEEERRAHDVWSGIVALERPGATWPTLRATTLPTALPAACDALDAAARAQGLEVKLVAQPALGVVDAWIRGLGPDSLASLEVALASAGARVHWRGLPDELRRGQDIFGKAEPAGLALMRRLRDALDPRGTFARGRLAGGL